VPLPCSIKIYFKISKFTESDTSTKTSNRKVMMSPLPSLIEALYCDSNEPKETAARSDDACGDINKCKSLMYKDSTAVALRPGISSRSHNEPPPQRQEEEEEEPEVSSFALKSSPTSEDPNICSSTFPRMLLKMLEDAESKDFENIVSWVPGQENLFRVYDSDRFTREIAPLYFKCTQYKSFQRQLNLYGFSRIKTGLYKGGYTHEMLVRGSPELYNCSSTFPRILLKMLEDAESKEFENILSWVPGQNNLFRVYDSDRFTREIAPLYFKCTQYKSFQRQLNLYGFSRIKTGLDKGGYTHELLVRGSPELCDSMIRAKVKGKKSLGSPVSMLSLSADTISRPLFSQEKGGRKRSGVSSDLEHMYQMKHENIKHATIYEALLDSCNSTSQSRDPAPVFGRNESHPRELQPEKLIPPFANHNDGSVANSRTISSIHYPPMFPSPLQSSGRAFEDCKANSGVFSRNEIMDEIIQTFYR
jgi:hypothetical protein